MARSRSIAVRLARIDLDEANARLTYRKDKLARLMIGSGTPKELDKAKCKLDIEQCNVRRCEVLLEEASAESEPQ